MMIIVICIGTIIILGYLSIKEHKKGNNDMIPLVYWALMISCLSLLYIYILDRYNLPTKWGWIRNLDSQNWLSFLGSYLTGVLTNIVNVMFLIGVTNIQLNHNREENMESLRIQNMPILKYDINDEHCKTGMLDFIWTKCENGVPYHLNFSIKNIGANTIKSFKIDVKHSINLPAVQRIAGYERNRIIRKR